MALKVESKLVRILIIEDTRNTAELLSSALIQAAFDVVTAADGESGPKASGWPVGSAT